MANFENLSDAELQEQYNKLLARKQDLSKLSNEELQSQYQKLGGKLPTEEPKPLYQRAIAAEAQGLGNIAQNIGKTFGIVSKKSQPWKIREALGVKTEPTGYERFATKAVEEVTPWLFPPLKLAKGVGSLANIINRGTAPAFYYMLQGKSPKEAAIAGYGGAALPEAAGPALKLAGKGISKISKPLKPLIEKGKQAYQTARDLPKYEQELSNLGNIENKLSLELTPKTFYPEENRILTHEENIGQIVGNELKNKQLELGEEYNKFKSSHENKSIDIGYKKSAQDVINEMKSEPTFSELFGIDAKSAEEQAHNINQLIVPDTKNLNTLFDNYRSLRTLAQRAMGKARSPGAGLTQDETRAYEAASEKYNLLADKLGNIIKDAGFEKPLTELKKINQRYSKEYAPVYKTNVFWSMRRKGKSPSDFLNEITGLTEGNAIYRKLVKSNPELRKAAISQHAKTPSGLIEKNVVLQPYLESEPKLMQQIQNYKEAIKQHPEIQKQIEKSKATRAYGLKLAKQFGIGAATLTGGKTAYDILK